MVMLLLLFVGKRPIRGPDRNWSSRSRGCFQISHRASSSSRRDQNGFFCYLESVSLTRVGFEPATSVSEAVDLTTALQRPHRIMDYRSLNISINNCCCWRRARSGDLTGTGVVPRGTISKSTRGDPSSRRDENGFFLKSEL